jgi:hypothetical protein
MTVFFFMNMIKLTTRKTKKRKGYIFDASDLSAASQNMCVLSDKDPSNKGICCNGDRGILSRMKNKHKGRAKEIMRRVDVIKIEGRRNKD